MKNYKTLILLIITISFCFSFKIQKDIQQNYKYGYYCWWTTLQSGKEVQFFTPVITFDDSKKGNPEEIVKNYIESKGMVYDKFLDQMYFKSAEAAEADRKKEMEESDNIFGKYTAKTYSFDIETKNKLKELN